MDDLNGLDVDINGLDQLSIDEKKDDNMDKCIKYYQIKILDIDSAADKLKKDLNNCINFIDNAINDNYNKNNINNRILIHCMAGVSRSSTVTIAYLMKTKNIKFNQAFEFVKEKRNKINPNNGFKKMLNQFEKEVFDK